MSYLSRDIHTRRCNCTVFTAFRCHCRSPVAANRSDVRRRRVFFCDRKYPLREVS